MKLNLSQRLIMSIILVSAAIIAFSFIWSSMVIEKREIDKSIEYTQENAKLLEADWYEFYDTVNMIGDDVVKGFKDIINSDTLSKKRLFDYFELLFVENNSFRSVFACYKDDNLEFSNYFYTKDGKVNRQNFSREQNQKLFGRLGKKEIDFVPRVKYLHNDEEITLNSLLIPVINNGEVKGFFGFNFNLDAFDPFLNQINKEKGAAVYLVGEDNTLLSNNVGIINGVHYLKAGIQQEWLEEEFSKHMIEFDKRLVMNLPIKLSPSDRGSRFIFTLSRDSIIDHTDEIQAINFFIMVVGVIVLSFFINKMVKGSLKPIDDIVDVMGHAEKGDLEKRTHIQSSDEIERIGTGLNNLLESLSDSRKNLLKEVEENKELNAELEELIQENDRMYFETIKSLNIALETKDNYTAGHCDRVTKYAMLIANQLNMTEKEKNNLFYGATIHDIGKIGIPGSILKKNGRLNDEEYNKIKSHPEKGYNILKDIHFLRDSINIVYQHHERYDGKGYPQGLKREEIDLSARIVAIADTFDAMTSDRAYRKALSFEVAVDELIKNKGTQFDPELVDIFVDTLKEKK